MSSPRPWPAPTPRRCGCTTSPAAGASASATGEVDKDEALAHLPTLDTDHLVAGFLYFDARADDARLTLTIARTAAFEFGAAVANYTPVVRLTTGRRRLRQRRRRAPGARRRDRPSSRSGPGSWSTPPGCGPTRCGRSTKGRDPHAIRPAKGVHVTVPADRLPCDIAAVIPVPKDKRSIFVVSWPGTDLVYLGTTDTDYTGPLDDPACTPEDVDYLLDAANNVTTSRLTRADVTGVWAGLRPLLAPPAKGGHVSERTADLSRRHTVTTSPHGVVTVTGGKLTTYRKMAQDTVDAVVSRLGESPRRRRCVTKSLPLIGATTKTRDPVALAQPHARLLGRYGTESAAVLALADGRPELLEPAVDGLPYTGAELVYAAREEMARTLDDVLSRRTRATIQRAHATMDAAAAVAAPHRSRHGLEREGGRRPGGPLHRVLPEGAPDRRARPPVTDATPVTPIDAAGADVEDRLGAPTAEVPAALLDRIAASGAAVSDRRRRPGRGRARLVAAGHRLGGRGRRPAAARRRGPARPRPRRWPRSWRPATRPSSR